MYIYRYAGIHIFNSEELLCVRHKAGSYFFLKLLCVFLEVFCVRVRGVHMLEHFS